MDNNTEGASSSASAASTVKQNQRMEGEDYKDMLLQTFEVDWQQKLCRDAQMQNERVLVVSTKPNTTAFTVTAVRTDASPGQASQSQPAPLPSPVSQGTIILQARPGSLINLNTLAIWEHRVKTILSKKNLEILQLKEQLNAANRNTEEKLEAFANHCADKMKITTSTQTPMELVCFCPECFSIW